MIFLLIGITLANTIVIDGSSTVYPLSNALISRYDKEVEFQNTSSGSSVGIKKILEGQVDIGTASRDLIKREVEEFKRRGVRYHMYHLASDALALAVHKSGPKIDNISRSDLVKIFITGEITRWEEIDKSYSGPIEAYHASLKSGTSYTFLKFLTDKKMYGKNVKEVERTQELVNIVKSKKNSIVALSNSLVSNEFKILNIEKENGEVVRYSSENVRNGSYPISRELYYLVKSPLEEKTASFLDFCLSEEGQEIIRMSGSIPVYRGKSEK